MSNRLPSLLAPAVVRNHGIDASSSRNPLAKIFFDGTKLRLERSSAKNHNGWYELPFPARFATHIFALWMRSITAIICPSKAKFPMTASAKVILASGSPRRRDLLAAAGIAFDVIESGIPEVPNDGEMPRDYALRMAREKARAVSLRSPGAIVIGADTIVVCDRAILEKPSSPGDARRMLRTLSGRTHVVITAFALARDGIIVESDAIESRVTFRHLASAEIDEYIATGEPLDKAGAYGIQGLGAGFIVRLEGSRDNVMGLPTEQVLAALTRQGTAR